MTSSGLTQVISNLLHNASKYMSPGGSINIRAERDGDRVQVRVRDAGVGIESTQLPHIFDLFVQGSRTLERSQGGMGLGLTLVKNLVELHGGSVTAHSGGLGQGSEFTISLPSHQGSSSSSSSSQTAVAEPIRPLRVLVIEDNVASAELLKKLLMKLWKHDVRVAYDGLAGLQQAIAFEPELVICDIGLPGMDGYEVCRRFREQLRMRDMLLVALTGYGTEDDRRMAKDAGFDEHLAKPASVQMLQRLSQHPKLLVRPDE